MTSSERALRREIPFAVSVALYAARDYAVASSGWVLAWTVPTRAVLQTAFFALLGIYANGDAGRLYALVGAVAYAAAPATINKVADVIVNDRWQGTMYRLRLGHLPILVVMVLRTTVYVLEGLLATVIGAVFVGLPLVGVRLTLRLVAAAPILAVLSISLACLGLAVAAASVGRRTDVLIANAASYLVLVSAGVVLPTGRSRWLDALGQVLPLRHGLVALRGWVIGRPAWGALAQEVAVAAACLALAGLVLAAQSHRARRGGFDEYA